MGEMAQLSIMRDFIPRFSLACLLAGCGDDSHDSSSATASGSSATTATTATPTTGASASASGSETSGMTGGALATSTAGATTGDDGMSTTLDVSTGGSTGAPACEVKLFPNVTSKQPVDVFLYFDASSSLGGVIPVVDEQLKILPDVLTAGAVDYRILVVSRWPHACLAPIDCTAPTAPLTVSEDGRLLYVHLGTGSSGVPDGYHSFLDSYWLVPYAQGETEPFLREGSVRVILGISDGEKSSNDVAGATDYLALIDERLGAGRHTIHTAGGFAPTGTLLDAMASLQGGACLGKDDSGPTQKAQQLSILTDGLRVSVCELSAENQNKEVMATVLFEQIAESATATSTQCEIPIPDTVEGDNVDPNNVEVDLVPSMGPTLPLMRYTDAMSCAADGFFIEGNVIHLCPTTCAAIKQDLEASLEIRHCVAPG